MHIMALTVLAILLLLAPFSSVLFDPTRVFTYRDFLQTFLPNKHVWVQSLLEFGELPMWNAFGEGGLPYWADLKNGVLYPLNLILLPFGTENLALGVSWFVFLHILLAFAGAFLMFRAFSFERDIAVLCSIPIALSGAFISSISMRGSLIGWMVMPFFFFFLRKWEFDRKRLFGWEAFGLSSCIALLIVGVGIEFAFLLGFFLTFYTVVHRKMSHLYLYLFVGVSGLLLGSAQLLPSFEFHIQSVRGSTGIEDNMAYLASFHPARLLELFLLLPFGNYVPNFTYWGSKFVNNHLGTPLFFSNFLGIFTLIGLLAVPKKVYSQYKEYMVLLALSLLLAFGTHIPINLYAIAREIIPGFAFFRYPEKFMIFVSFILLVFASMGWREVFDHYRNQGFIALISKRFGIAFSALAIITVGFFLAQEKTIPFMLLAQAFAFGGLYLLVPFLTAKRVEYGKYLALLLLLVVGIEFSLHTNAIRWDQPTAILASPLAKSIQEDLENRSEEIKTGGAFRYNSFYARRESLVEFSGANGVIDQVGKLAMSHLSRLLPNTTHLFGIYDTDMRGAVRIQEKLSFLKTLFEHDDEKAMDLVGAYYIGRFSNLDDQEIRFTRNLDALPYVFFPKHIHSIPERARIIDLLKEERFSVQDSAIVERALPASILANSSFSSVLNIERSSNTRIIDIRRKDKEEGVENYVFINESYSPHWHAKIGSTSLDTYRGNNWSVAIDLGESCMETCRLELRYENPYIFAGLAASLITFLLLFLLCFVWKRQEN